ncbi:MAG: GNAT family protein [Polyangiaceae bacterium]
MQARSSPGSLELHGRRLTLRPVRDEDVTGLFDILAQPSVASRWSEPDPEFDRALLLGDEADEAEHITTWAVCFGGKLVGWIAGWEKLDRDYRHAGVDLFLDSAHQGAGFGPEAIRLVCRYLFEQRAHHRVTIDPAADNLRAIRAYEKVGFKRVGVLRRYERGSDGRFHDGMLLDLLPEDLTHEA